MQCLTFLYILDKYDMQCTLSLVFLLVLSFSIKSIFAAEFIIQGNSRVNYSEFVFTDNSKYLTLSQVGQWTDSLGNYGSSLCMGLVKKDSKDTVELLDVVCESQDQNNIITWRKFERIGISEIERGVGVSTIIDTTSKHRKELLGTKCKYAVNRTKDMVFSKAVCTVSEELYRKLIK